MHVRVRRLGRGHFILGNGENEIHVQDALVELRGRLGVLAAIGDVVNALEIDAHE